MPNMERPLISFIVPVFNTPMALLNECLASIEDVDTTKEIIIIDDGSQQDYKIESNNAVLYKIPHSGLSAARNYGIEKTIGEYIQFVDADDTLLPSYQQIVKLIIKERADIVTLQARTKRCESLLASSPILKYYDNGIQYMLSKNIYGSACQYLFRRSILGNLRFTPNTLHEDEEFTPLLLLRAKMLIQTNIIGYFYRTTKNSITTRKDAEHITKRLDDGLSIIQRLNSLCLGLDNNKERCALRRRISQLCMDYLYNIIRLRRCHELQERINVLKSIDLYPLPLKNYTTKYYLFALLTRL